MYFVSKYTKNSAIQQICFVKKNRKSLKTQHFEFLRSLYTEIFRDKNLPARIE